MRLRILLCGVLLAAVCAVYWPVLGHEFVHYDDYAYIVDNPRVRADGGLSRMLARATEPALANWNPLTVLSLQLDAAAHDLSSKGVHATNLALHALATLLLFLALCSLTGALWPPFLVAAVFGLHPQHVESVAWAAERKDVLCAVFWMTTLWAYSAWAARPSWPRQAAVLVSLALALLAKPMAVTLPFVLLLLDLWPLARLRDPDSGSPLDPGRVRRALLEKLPHFALVAAVSVVTYVVQQSAGAVQTLDRLPLATRLGNAMLAYAAYAADAFWPVGLAVFYPLADLEVWRVALAVGAGTALTGLAALQLRSRPQLLVGWLWFVGTLVPVIGIVQVGLQARADRYMYLPQIGLAIAFFFTAAELPRRWPAARWPLAAASTALLAALAFGTSQQIPHWADTTALFTRAVHAAPGNYFAHRGLGDAHVRAGRLDEARVQYAEAARLRPSWSVPHVGVADILVLQGQQQESLAHFERALALDPSQPRANVGYGLALLQLGRFDEAEQHLERALRIFEAAGLLGGRGGPPHLGLARIAAARGDVAQEVEHYETALRLAPNLESARVDLGYALVRAGRVADADRQFARAAAAGVGTPELVAGRGVVAEQLGRPLEAARYYRRALAVRPQWPAIQNNLAWILASSSDPELRAPEEALELASEAVAATQRSDPGILDTLAASQAAVGDYGAAVATQREAIELARAAGIDGMVPELERHLEAYEAGRSQRSP